MNQFKNVLENMDSKTYLFGAIFVVANKLQQLGDEFDERITLKQWRILTAIAFCEGTTGASISEIADFTSSSGQNVKKKKKNSYYNSSMDLMRKPYKQWLMDIINYMRIWKGCNQNEKERI